MDKDTVKVTHLFHSGFLIQTKNHHLIFDYFNPRPRIDVDETSLITSDFFKDKKNIFVFSTHRHIDHFDSKILSWHHTNENIKYVLSDDIKLEHSEKYHYFMKPYQEKSIDDIQIITYGSTDLGVSFLVNVDGVSIFHAGDLNWWHWNSNSKEDNDKEEKDFKAIVNKIIGKEIDIAFIPVDPRLGEYCYQAGEFFVNKVKPKMIVPMHFGNHYAICKAFHDKISNFDVLSPILSEDNKSFTYHY